MIGGKFGMIEPLVIFGALSIISGLLLFLLPETHKQKLPDTIAEGEQFGRYNCYYIYCILVYKSTCLMNL